MSMGDGRDTNRSGLQSWFLKMTGPEEQVREHMAAFLTVLKSLDFVDGKPTITVPDGWSSRIGPPPRYQTLTAPDTDPPIELSVTALSLPSDDIGGYIKANIDRWRGQLGLEPMTGDDWMDKAKAADELTISGNAEQAIAIVNLTGTTKEFGETHLIATIIIPNGEEGSEPPSKPAPQMSKPVPFTYDTPEGWSEGTGNSFRILTLETKTDEGPVEMSVTRFPGGGELLENVNRWRRQVEMEPIPGDELDSHLTKISIGGIDSWVAAAEGTDNSIIAAIVPDGEAKWFFKLTGKKSAVATQREQFDAFLKSIEFLEESN